VPEGDRAMSTSRSEWPSAPDFHPEFGLLCPSARKRRGIRLVTASLIAGMAIGATIELAVAHWRDSDVAQSRAANSIDEEPSTQGTAIQPVLDIPVASAPPPASTADTGELTVIRSQVLCKDIGATGLAAEFLNPTCGSVKPHARHSARTTNRVATVIIGHAGAPAPAAAEPTPGAVAVGAAGKALIPTTQAVERPVPPPKKPKAAPSAPIALAPPTRVVAQQDAGSMAYAAAPRLGGYYDRTGDLFRAAVPPTPGGPFGGIW
jgi:hypothetical protein